ncbi:MAG: methyl-accepting chemotaxis protein [Candidatus Omnitrophota bacterium]
MRMTIGKKLGFGFGAVLLLMLILGVASFWTTARLDKISDEAIKDLNTDMLLDEGIADHLKWAFALSDQFLLDKPFEGELDPHKCKFGQWYDTFKSDDPEIMKIHASIDEPHKRLHKSGATIKELLAKGDKAGAQQVYAKEVSPLLEEIREKILKIGHIYMSQSEEGMKTQHAMSQRVLPTIITIIILAVILGFVIAALISRRITKTLRAVADKVNDIAGAAGDLTATVPVVSNDEIGDLARAFNKMLAGLKAMVMQILETAERISASSQQLSSSAQEMNATTEEVSSTVQQIAKGSETTAQRVEETSKVMEQMNASVSQVATSAQQAASASVQASQSAQKGGELAKDAVNKMNKIYETISGSAVVVKKLGERSEQINEIVNVITGIADQTNLLALNAAIEAARAGEQGRGFAVVAEEVRKLAEGSAKAADQIAKLIKDIQKETNYAVESMDTGSKEAAEGKEVVNKAGTALNEIIKVVENTASMVEQISAATQQMSAGTKQVVKSVDDIASTAEEAASATEEASASTEEMTASMQEMAASAQELSEMAINLRELVGKFKIADSVERIADRKPETQTVKQEFGRVAKLSEQSEVVKKSALAERLKVNRKRFEETRHKAEVRGLKLEAEKTEKPKEEKR